MSRATSLIRRRVPFAYRLGREAFEALSNRLPPWRLSPIAGPVSRADLMLRPALTTRPPADAVAYYDLTGRQAAAFLAEAVTESGRAPADVGSVFDLGCGHGRVARHLGTTFPNARVGGCDLDPRAAAFCRKHLGIDAVPVGTDPSGLPLGPYDVIWMGSVLTHIDEVSFQNMVREVTARLMEGGVVAFTTHSPDVLQYFPEVPENEARAALAANGIYYRAYPHSADGSYGLSYHTPQYVEQALAAHPVRKVVHHHRHWGDRQDVWAYARS